MGFSYKMNPLTPCHDMDEQKFWELCRSGKTRMHILEHRRLRQNPPFGVEAVAQKEADRHKRMLPCAIWQCQFPDGSMNHNTDPFSPSGFFALDIDHVEDPMALFESFRDKLEENYCTLVHITPSGHGLRVVAQCHPDFQTLAQNQAWLAQQLGTDYDPVCKNWSRIWFLPMESEILYYNPEMFEE